MRRETPANPQLENKARSHAGVICATREHPAHQTSHEDVNAATELCRATPGSASIALFAGTKPEEAGVRCSMGAHGGQSNCMGIDRRLQWAWRAHRGVDGTEREVLGSNRHATHQIEGGRFPDVWEPDDTHLDIVLRASQERLLISSFLLLWWHASSGRRATINEITVGNNNTGHRRGGRGEGEDQVEVRGGE